MLFSELLKSETSLTLDSAPTTLHVGTAHIEGIPGLSKSWTTLHVGTAHIEGIPELSKSLIEIAKWKLIISKYHLLSVIPNTDLEIPKSKYKLLLARGTWAPRIAVPLSHPWPSLRPDLNEAPCTETGITFGPGRLFLRFLWWRTRPE